VGVFGLRVVEPRVVALLRLRQARRARLRNRARQPDHVVAVRVGRADPREDDGVVVEADDLRVEHVGRVLDRELHPDLLELLLDDLLRELTRLVPRSGADPERELHAVLRTYAVGSGYPAGRVEHRPGRLD